MLEKIVVDDLTVTDENTDQCEIEINEIDMDNIHTSEIGEQVIFKA